MKKYKYLSGSLILVLLFLLTFSKYVYATPINLISSLCSTSGYSSHYSTSWDLTDPNNVSALASDGNELAYATVDVMGSTASLDAWTNIIEWGSASAEIIFQPSESTSIYISADAYSSGIANGLVEFVDITESETLFWFFAQSGVADFKDPWLDISLMQPMSIESFEGDPWVQYVDYGNYIDGFYIESLIPIYSDHTYSLRTTASVVYSDMAAAKVSMLLLPVPEPATMLLLGSGLVGLAGFRRRFFKK